MSGETSHLQRLSNEQVASRLQHYGNNGELEGSLRWLWEQAGDAIENACKRQFGEEGGKVVRAYMTRPIDVAWVHTVAKHGRLMYANKQSVPEFIAARARMTREVLGEFDHAFAGKPEDRLNACDAFVRLMTFSEDIILAQVAVIEADEAADARGKHSEQFQSRVSGLVRASNEQSRNLTERTRATAATRPVLRSAKMTIAGRSLDIHVSPFAASEADLWIYDPKTKVAIVGDLVVDIVPFMDSACPDGWAKALDEVEKVPFQTLIPGHGAPMTRADFSQWKLAFNNLVKCGRSSADKATCAAGWKQDAAKFIDEAHKDYAGRAADYYITTRLRSSPEEQQKFCKPLKAG